MLERIEDLPPGIDGLKAVGRVTRQDYTSEFRPLVDAALRDDHRLRLLYEIGADFDGFTPGAMLADAQLTLRSLRNVEGFALVTDVAWLRAWAGLLGPMLPFPVRVFDAADRHLAIEWLSSLSHRAGASHHLLTDSGVLVIEVSGRLHTRDIDALAITADTWIELHGELTGVVVHARRLPGWADLANLRALGKFVREHHRKVARVALSTDSRLGRFAPIVTSRAIAAQVRAFDHDELQAAIDWASGPSRARERPRIVPVQDIEEAEHEHGEPPS